MMSSYKGFTLIELVVTLFLIALISSVVLLSVAGRFFVSDESRFLQNTFLLVKEARGKAIREYEKVNVCVIPSERKIAYDNKSVSIPENITVREVDLVNINDKYCYVFLGNGSSSGGELNFSWGENEKGQIKVEKFFGRVSLNE